MQQRESRVIFKELTKVKKRINGVKLSIKLLTLCASLYGLYITAMNATLISILLTALMIVGWILSFVLEIISSVVATRIDILLEAVMNDVDFIIKPINFFLKLNKNNNITPIPNQHEKEIEEMLKEFLEDQGAVQPPAVPPAVAPAPAPIAPPTTSIVAQAIAPAKAPKKKLFSFGRKKK